MATNWQDTYEKLRKQKEALDRLGGNDIISNSNIKFNASSTSSSKKKKDEDEDKWFKSGAFDDGYQIGDIAKTILGTAGDVAVGAVKGIGNLGEGLLDLGTYAASGIADLFGNEKAAERIKRRGQETLVNDWLEPLENKVDKNSLLGGKADNITQGLGYVGGILLTGGLGAGAGLGTVGTTALTTGLTGFSGMGSGMSEAYQGGATDKEAVTFGAIAGLAEAGTELIFGGLGKAVNATGLSVGLSSADDMLAKKISSKFSSQIAKNFAEYGVKAGAEGLEEVMSGFIQGVGKYYTYQTKEDGFDLKQIIEDENLLDQFIAGAVTSGIAQSGIVPGMKNGSLIEANKTGKDFITGYTQNEQAVIDAEIAARTEGQQLTKKQKSKIQEEVIEDFEKGYISTDRIESTLGGNTYNELKSLRDNKVSIENQIKELESKPNAEITVKEMEQLNALREELKTVDTNTLESKLQAEMSGLIKSDGYLQRSYQEKAKRSQEFTYETAETDSDFRKGVMESTKGKLNDTTRSHETAEALVKLSEDRQMQYKFTNNAELTKLGLVPEGKTANGLYVVDKDGSREILVNTDSKKYIEAVLVHETAHDFQTTSPDTYTKLVDITKQFAEAQNEYSRVYSEVAGMYKNVEGVNIEEEVTSRLLEEYVGNKDFINSLTKQEPNIVQKIIEEIKYLVKKFTAGSPEARKLVELQHNLEKTYKEAYKQTKTTETTEGVKYSVSDNQNRKLSKEQQEYFKDSKARDDDGSLTTVYHTSPNAGFTVFEGSKGQGNYKFGEYGEGITYFTDSKEMSESYSRNREEAGTYEGYVNLTNPLIVDAKGRNWNRVTREYSQETYEKYKSLNEIERDYLMDLASWDDARLFASTIRDANKWVNIEHKTDVGEDNVALASAYNKLEDVDLYDLYDVAANDFSDESMRENSNITLSTNDVVKKALKDGSYDGVIIKNVVDYGSGKNETPANVYVAFNSNQFKNADNTNPTADKDIRYSLSEEQENYFKDSKLRDEKGNLEVVYHSTPNEFTVFDNNMLGENTGYENTGFGTFVTTNKAFSERFKDIDGNGTKGYTMELFANVTNPITHPYNAYEKYGYNELNKILTDYLEATNNKDGLNYLNEMVEDGEAENIYEAYQILTQEGNAFENAANERKILEEKGYDAVEIVEGIERDIVDGSYSNEPVSSYAIFNSNQLKNVDNLNPTTNEDINLSLSKEADIAPASTRTQTATQDIRLEVEEAIAPLVEEITQLKEELRNITDIDYAPATQETAVEQGREAFNTIDDADMPIEETTITEDIDYDFLDADAKELLRELSNGSTRTINALYNEIANSESVAQTRNILDKYKNIYDEDYNLQEIKKTIRNTKLNTSYVKGQITDYNYFRKSNFGKLRLGKDGMSIDSFYQELSEMYPTYFDPEINTTADQLERLAEVVNGDSTYLIDTIDNETMDKYARDIHNAIKINEIVNQNKAIPLGEAPVEIVDNSVDNVSNTEIAPSKVNIAEAIRPKPTQDGDTHGYRLIRVKTDAELQTETNEEIAKILTEEPKVEDKRNKRKWAILKANVLDKGLVFEDVSLKHKNRELMGKWDYTLTSEARGQNVIGNGHYEYDPYSKTQKQVSKSLNDIRAEVDNTGLTTEFYEYIYHKHNVDRMRLEGRYEGMENKPVFGYNVTAEQSQQVVNKYESQHPEFITFAQDVYDYLDADRQVLVDSGVISQETADLWKSMYPHYVPIRRAGHNGNAINVPLDTGRTGVNAPIKKATGGNKDILPLFDTMASRTLQTYRATAKNSFGVELKNTIGTTINSQATNIDEVIDSVDAQEELLQEGKNGQKPTFTVFEDGKKITFEITEDMYDALKPLDSSSILSKTYGLPSNISGFHRGVLTQYNPVFMLTNAIKDAQDVLINSQHAAKTYAKVPEATAQLISKGYWYQEYMNNGGEHNSYFDSVDNTFTTENKGLKKVLDLPPLKQIAQMNDFVERIPRLAEYIASREAGRSIEVSMLDAARVTTNFKAGGNLTKFLNRNGATFLNASVQGAMQQVRNIREANANGIRGWANLATKFAIAGLPAILLNSLLWEDDEEYEELSDYVKQNYYIVAKNEDGTFIRIPKGRTVAVIQEGVRQMQNLATGDDEVDLKTFLDLFITNLAPNNPIDNNVLSPVIQAVQNKTWYGEDLVPTRLQDLPAAEQYDESTDSFSRWLGEKTNISPVKINYLLDQYSGGVGDVVLPMMTPEAKTDADTLGEQLLAPLKSKFTANSTMNNQNVSDFYDKSEELTTNAKKSNATDEDVLRNKYINSVKAEMNELYAEKREIQNSDLSNSEKYNRVLEIQSQINELSKEALNEYKNVDIYSNYATAGDRQYRLTDEGEWQKINDKQLEKQNNVTSSLGITPNDYWGNKEEYDYAYENPSKYALANAIADYSTFRQLSSELYDIKADKDENGKSISGTRKEKVFDYINDLDLSFEQRVMLAKLEYPSYDEYNYEIIEYLNNRDDINYEQMVSILTELGFTVKKDGTITWD